MYGGPGVTVGLAGSDRLQRRIRRAREAVLAAADPDERAHLRKKLRKFESRAAPQPIVKSIPDEAFRLRHRYHK